MQLIAKKLKFLQIKLSIKFLTKKKEEKTHKNCERDVENTTDLASLSSHITGPPN